MSNYLNNDPNLSKKDQNLSEFAKDYGVTASEFPEIAKKTVIKASEFINSQLLDLKVVKKDNENTISSLDIAKHLEIQHESLQRLILNYKDKLELFGLVRFEIGAKNSKVYYLNENQAIFLSTLSKNNEKVVKFKAILTKTFSNLKEKQKQPKELTRLEILELALESEKERQRLKRVVIERAESVPAQTMRLTINRIVRDFAKRKQVSYPLVWRMLYEEFKYHYHIDLKARAKKGQSKIEIVENLGKLEDLYNLSLKLFEVEKNLTVRQEAENYFYVKIK